MNRMKRTKLSVLWTWVLLVIFSACSPEKENYLSSLPAESSVVVKLNMVQMAQKLDVMENEMVRSMFNEFQTQVPEPLKAKFDEIRQNPRSAGLDLEKPLAISVTLNNLDKPQIVAVAALNKGDKFNDLMVQLASADESVTIEKLANGLQRIQIKGNNETDFVYNDNRIVMTANLDATQQITQQAEQSILSNPNFKECAESTNDCSLFLNCNWLTEILKQTGETNVDLPSSIKLLQDYSAFLTTNFEPGKIVCKSKTYTSDELKQFQEKLYTKPSGKFIGLLPTDTYLAVNGGIKNLSLTLDMMGEKEKAEAEKAYQQMGLTREILNSIEGDFTLGIFNDTNTFGTPGVLLAVECKDRSFFDIFKKELGYDSVEGDVLDVLGYHIAYMDGALIAATKNIYDQCLAEGKIKDLNESIKNTSLKDILEKGGTFIDFQAMTNIPFWNDILGSAKLGNTLNVLKQLNTLTSQSENLQEGTTELTFKDPNKNALAQLIAIAITYSIN